MFSRVFDPPQSKEHRTGVFPYYASSERSS